MTWQAVSAFFAGLWAVIKPYLPELCSFLAGMKYQQGSDAKQALEAIDEAAQASAAVRNIPRADKLRILKQHGALRDVEAPQTGDK